VLPRREPAELRAVLPVFSRVALAAVATLAVTGTYAAWRGVGTVHAIFTTTYGLLVVVKVALFVGVLLVANLSRKVIQRRFAKVPVAYAMSDAALADQAADEAADDGPHPVEMERLRRSVLVEIALAIGVLVATSVLVAQPRGKEAIAARELRPASAVGGLGDGRDVTVTITPGRHGTVTTDVVISSGTQPQKVTVAATLPAKQLGPIPVPLKANGTRAYAGSGVNLPVAGNWLFTVIVTDSKFDATAEQVKIHLY
jgi:copper transport protein